MADSNTTATPAPDGTTTDHGSEFSKPAGAKDAEVWDKHFGKEAKGKPKDSSGKSEKSAGGKEKTTSGSRSEKASDESTKRTESSTKPSNERTSDKEPSKPKDTKSDKTADKTEPSPKDKTKTEKAEPDGKDTDKDTDPEAPHKKAKDLYEQAKKTEDRREARKLYKRAMTEAFGEVPAEFDDRRYAAVRQERQAAKAALDAQGQKNEGRIREAAEKLKPAIYVMRQLEGSGLGDKLTVPMVERAVHVMRALKSLEDGDYTQLAEVVSRAAGVDHDEAMKRFVRGVKVSPEGRAARVAAAEAERRATETERQLAVLRQQLSDKDTASSAAQKKQEHDRQVQESRAVYLDNIESELDGHAVLDLPRGKERVLAYLIKTAHPTLKTPRFSFEEAANRVVAHERKRVQGARHLLDDVDSDEPAPARSSGTRRLTDVSRSETVDAGVRAVDPEARFSEIFDKHAAGTRAGGQRRRR
jgi:hypothetical protein